VRRGAAASGAPPLAAVLVGTLIAGCGGASKPPTVKATAPQTAQAPTAGTARTSTTRTRTSPTSTAPATKTPTTATPSAKKPTQPHTSPAYTHTTKPSISRPPPRIPSIPHPKIVTRRVVSLSTRNPSTVCPALKKDLKSFAQQSEAPLTVRTFQEEKESFRAIKAYSAALAQAVPGLKEAFPEAKPAVERLKTYLKVFRSTIAANGSRGNPTLLVGPAERVIRAGEALEPLCGGH
jgi:hypothetical protein